MGLRNVLVEGVSGTGKSSVCRELRRRGLSAVDGDRELAYTGDPDTGEPRSTPAHEHHLWRVEVLRERLADASAPVTYFCGGSRNVFGLVDLFDAVVVLHVDAATLQERLRRRGADEFGGTDVQRAFIARLHRTGEDVPPGIPIDAVQPLERVVDEIVAIGGAASRASE